MPDAEAMERAGSPSSSSVGSPTPHGPEKFAGFDRTSDDERLSPRSAGFEEEERDRLLNGEEEKQQQPVEMPKTSFTTAVVWMAARSPRLQETGSGYESRSSSKLVNRVPAGPGQRDRRRPN